MRDYLTQEFQFFQGIRRHDGLRAIELLGRNDLGLIFGWPTCRAPMARAKSLLNRLSPRIAHQLCSGPPDIHLIANCGTLMENASAARPRMPTPAKPYQAANITQQNNNDTRDAFASETGCFN